MLLFHFTCLVYLPRITQEGITLGEVPIPGIEYKDRPQAANLTTNPNRNEQLPWARGIVIDKTRIRLTVDVPDSELTSFREVKEQYKLKSKWVNTLAPLHVRQHWYFAFGGIRPDQIKLVEKWDNNRYASIEDLQKLIHDIEIERDRIMTFTTLDDGALGCNLNPGIRKSWLLDGPDAPFIK